MKTILLAAIPPIALMGGSARSAEIAMQPIRASGAHTIVGTEIFISGPQRVFLEVHISGFAPHALRTYQARLDSAGYATGAAGVLAAAVEPCSGANSAGNSHCQSAFGDAGFGASYCVDFDSGPDSLFRCMPAWMNRGRTDWIFYGLNTNPDDGAIIYMANYLWGSTLGGDLAFDAGDIYYGGSLAVDVPADAAGTFTIGFLSGPGISFLSDENNNEISPLVLTPAKITVLCAGECDDEDKCTRDECTPGGCAHSFIEGCGNIPAVSEWGLAVLALSLLIYGKLRFAARRAPRFGR